MLVFETPSLAKLSNMECSCTTPVSPAVMVTRGSIFHPLFCMVLISGSYLVCLCLFREHVVQ